jgi:hypothetical protein
MIASSKLSFSALNLKYYFSKIKMERVQGLIFKAVVTEYFSISPSIDSKILDTNLIRIPS